MTPASGIANPSISMLSGQKKPGRSLYIFGGATTGVPTTLSGSGRFGPRPGPLPGPVSAQAPSWKYEKGASFDHIETPGVGSPFSSTEVDGPESPQLPRLSITMMRSFDRSPLLSG